jgi:ABC-type transport system substrate-binding protein
MAPTQATKSTTTIIATSITKTATTPTVTSTASTGNWWDKLGTPTYGGQIVIRFGGDMAGFDPWFMGSNAILCAWLERLFAPDWTMDPAVFDYKIRYEPADYVKGFLAQSFEFTDPTTFVVHLRQGIHWQNIPPANGRELTSDDVAFNFDRMYGLGHGYTTQSPYQSTVGPFKDLISVTPTDKYTDVFKWKTPNPAITLETMEALNPFGCIVNPEAVKLWGDVNDWHRSIGTGPFILKDFLASSSALLIKNPDYWGYDERYPKNQLPYVDTLKFVVIPDNNTAIAGKIDAMEAMTLQQSNDMKKASPQIIQVPIPYTNCLTVDPRNDKAPFTDIRVRKAMQLAIDLPTIAKDYYGSTIDPYPQALTSSYQKGYGVPYTNWPQDLKDEYAYNPTAAKKLLADAGFPNGFKTNVVADNTADLDLLQVVKAYFAAVGIDMNIRTMDTVSWNTYVRINHQHDQMAYKSGLLGNIFEIAQQLIKFQLGNVANYTMVNDPDFNAFYTKGMGATNIDTVLQTLKDVNLYVARQHYVTSLLQPMTYSFAQPWLKGYNGQYNALSSNTGAVLLYFFPPRFWIDQNLKKTMGF